MGCVEKQKGNEGMGVGEVKKRCGGDHGVPWRETKTYCTKIYVR